MLGLLFKLGSAMMSGGWFAVVRTALQIVSEGIAWGRRERDMSIGRQQAVAEMTINVLTSNNISHEVVAETLAKSREQKIQDLEDMDAFAD